MLPYLNTATTMVSGGSTINSFGMLNPRSCLCGHDDVVYSKSKFTCTAGRFSRLLDCNHLVAMKSCRHRQDRGCKACQNAFARTSADRGKSRALTWRCLCKTASTLLPLLHVESGQHTQWDCLITQQDAICAADEVPGKQADGACLQ